MLRLLLPLPLALSVPGVAAAQSSVVIWPVDPQIKAGEQATALWLENRGKEPVTLQVRTFAWDQANGADRYTEQNAVVSSPPIAKVGGGQRQLIRIIRRAPDKPGEHAYRLIIDEIPQLRDGGDEAVSAQLAVQMRYSIPLFTYGIQEAKPTAALSADVELSGGKRWLVVANKGATRARLTDLRARTAQGTVEIRQGLAGYVLAGAVMRWPLPESLGANPNFTVAVDGVEQTLGLAS